VRIITQWNPSCLALEGEVGISRGLPPLIPIHKKNNAKLPHQASYWQWGQIGTTPDCTYLSTIPSPHITPLDNTKAELTRGTAYFNKDTRYMLYISPPDTDKFFDAQETPSFSPMAYNNTQEEAFFDCMEKEDDQHYLLVQQPRLNRKRKREPGTTGSNQGKKTCFFSNRKVLLEHPPAV
jgi:hypothetical protein